MLVPWNDVLAVIDDGLRLMLSTADVVKSFVLTAVEQTTPSSTYWHASASPNFAGISRTLSYESLLFLVLAKRQSQVHRKGCFTCIAMSVIVGSFLVVGKVVELQQLRYSEIKFRLPLLKLWLDVCAVFNHAYKCNKWWRGILLNTSIEESVGERWPTIVQRVSTNKLGSLGQVYCLTVLGWLG